MINVGDKYENRVTKRVYVVVKVHALMQESDLVAEDNENKRITLNVNNLQNFIFIGKVTSTLSGKSLHRGGTGQVRSRRNKKNG